ncbi:hypothetical protein MARA_03420 (plasmid) [Mycolicibacterium arabiense]|uniref:Uncharacterized protein n=1 Tax=Mycolicibacterium arabiense TaxID=1286181 RepID=A0A7I7RQS9_9MYCO|nr:hypothetical protein MARA_03420 [Mycolicibacterium arabiense]
MKERTWSARADLGAALPTEVLAVLGTAIAVAFDGPWWAGAAGGAVVGLLLFVVTVSRLTPWQWLKRAIGRLRHKEHRVEAAEFVDVDSDGKPLGVRVDEHTTVTMVHVWGGLHTHPVATAGRGDSKHSAAERDRRADAALRARCGRRRDRPGPPHLRRQLRPVLRPAPG